MARQTINDNEQPFGGPNSGLGREEGDSWNAAVRKLNENFSELYNSGGSASQSTITGSMTLDDSLSGKILYYTGATDITVTVPAGLSPSFSCALVQGGAGIIITTTTNGSGVSINSPRGFTSTSGNGQ